MTTFTSQLFRPFRNTYRYLQYTAHEYPVLLFSLIIGSIGPIAVLTVPPIRKAYGWKPSERIPQTYPVPQHERRQVTGYDDDEE